MRTIQTEIIIISGEYYFAYKIDRIITPPTYVDKKSSVVISPCEGLEIKIASNIDDLYYEMNRMGFYIPKEDMIIVNNYTYAPWIHLDKGIRSFQSHRDYNRMIREVDGILDYFKINNIVFEEYEDGGFIYINEIYPEHEYILNSYNAKITRHED